LVDKTPAELDPGTPSDTSIVHASENGVSTNSKGHDERDISRLQGTAPLYSSSKTYNVNDLVTESGTVFRNITAITIPEIFTPSKWVAISGGSEVGNRKVFNTKRQVSIYPRNDFIVQLIMVGEGSFNIDGDNTGFFDTDGLYIEYRVTTDMGAGDGGFFIVNCLRREHNFDITVKFRVPATADRRFWTGFFTADPASDDNPTAEHIGLRLSTSASNVNFVISHADGATQAETQLAVADTAIHTIRIVSDEANSKFQYSFDGVALTDITTNIPSATTDLDIYSQVFALAGGTLPHWDFWFLDGISDK